MKSKKKSPGISSLVTDYAISIEVNEGHKQLEKDSGSLLGLLLPSEEIKYAFRFHHARNDAFYLTTYRVLIQDCKGVTSVRKNYTNIPFKSINAFNIEPSSKNSVSKKKFYNLNLFCQGTPLGVKSLLFLQDLDKNLMENLYIFLGSVVLEEVQKAVTEDLDFFKRLSVTEFSSSDENKATFDNFHNYSHSVFAHLAQERFSHLLLPDETVELAIRCCPSSFSLSTNEKKTAFLLTSKRLLRVQIDNNELDSVATMGGAYLSIKWSCIKAFSHEICITDKSSNSFSNSSNTATRIIVYTCVPQLTRIEMNLQKSTSNITNDQGTSKVLLNYISDVLLGLDTGTKKESFSDKSKSKSQDSSSCSIQTALNNFYFWMEDNNIQINVPDMNELFQNHISLLQCCEYIEMAIKAKRDVIFFTNKRLLVLDLQNFELTEKIVHFISIPWKTIQAFGFFSSSTSKNEAEAFLWTDLNDIQKQETKNSSVSIPGMSFMKFDINTQKTDVISIKRYLSERCLFGEGACSPYNAVPIDVIADNPGILESYLEWSCNSERKIDQRSLNNHTIERMLKEDEYVVMAFKAHSITTIFTNKRVMKLGLENNTKEESSNGLECISIPYHNISAFSVSSHGAWDKNSSFRLHSKTYWNPHKQCLDSTFEFDFTQDKNAEADIIAIHNLLTCKVVIHSESEQSSDFINQGIDSTFQDFFSWIHDEVIVNNPIKLSEKLHSKPCLIDRNENVDSVYKTDKGEIHIATNKRLLLIDANNASQLQVRFSSSPLRYCIGYSLKTSGHIEALKPAEVQIFMNIPSFSIFRREVKKASKELAAIQKLLGCKLLLTNVEKAFVCKA